MPAAAASVMAFSKSPATTFRRSRRDASRATGRDERSLSLALINHAFVLEFEIGARHRVWIHCQLQRQLPHRGQRFLRLEASHRYRALDLLADLQVNRRAVGDIDSPTHCTK